MNVDTSNEILADFVMEAGELVEKLGEQLIEMEKRPDDQELLNAIFRAFHTVKGGAGFLNFGPMVDLCHAAEDVFNLLRSGKREMDQNLLDAILQSVDHLQVMMAQVSSGESLSAAPAALIKSLHDSCVAPAPVVVKVEPAASSNDAISDDEFEALLDQFHGSGKAVAPVVEAAVETPAKPEVSGKAVVAHAPPPETTIRVDTNRLDKMMNLVGELVLLRNRLKILRGSSSSDDLSKAIGQLDFITRSLQGAVMQIRMRPVRKVFSRFPKVARDVARALGKQVEVELVGEDTDLDKNLVDALADPLVHMVRNAVDHGIEMPDVRKRAGKSEAGHLVLAARQQGDHILISISDDGAGIDSEKLRKKVVEKGLLTEAAAERLSPDECLQLVFMPGFSTKEQISDLSGRGVGMDVVKSAITNLKGTVKIESRIGNGSVVLIQLPLTLAILPALMVSVAGRTFAMPLSSVIDVTVLNTESIRRLDKWDVVLIRDELVRLIHLDRWAGVRADPELTRHVVLANVDNERYGFVVSQVRGREEVVIKPLGAMLRGLTGLAGATVTGQGRVALILDFPGLIKACSAGGG
ncbi:chemotaxis protein CheA [Stenotrophobium rhamnosiphilum]|uniref:Chemotaxis protein CheA n=1 Tax=Stenotrophobium rhamnosiphilum TaxID=2029166 RepID=A0A2T5MDA2_9GAMM|nr:chemotaxis protein CheA [Stenotrophobium rhamnosiphilum]PTU30548.1 chemotaxis protein CheA [Stenotrophobium rhamnosiphilum]